MMTICSTYPLLEQDKKLSYPIIGLFIEYIGNVIFPNLMKNKLSSIYTKLISKESEELPIQYKEYIKWCHNANERVKKINSETNDNVFDERCFENIKQLANKNINFVEMQEITEILRLILDFQQRIQPKT